MATRIITLCYRKIIDAQTTTAWDKLVLDATHTEYLMQAQYYDQQKQHHTFAQLIQHVPNASKLHYLVSSACIGYLQQLNEKIPGVYDILGQQFLTFDSFKFEIINSDVNNINAHQVAISFYTGPLTWHDTIGNYLVLSDSNQDGLNPNAPQLTNLLQLVPFLSIHTINITE